MESRSGRGPVPLTVYGSLVTEVAPNAVPETSRRTVATWRSLPVRGSRPALQRCLASPFAAGGRMIRSEIVGCTAIRFHRPDSEFTMTPTGFSGLSILALRRRIHATVQSTPGSYASSQAVWPRLHRISDGLHGAEVPLHGMELILTG